ncbi:MAG: DUF655 domain-containing protein [Candidatus Marsarchaeota archaeon]|jgi:putative nucleotide binding protein|nr:DUF655 domain-containing protein [Candidatus Marsarchaeota archaeon]MCL5418919.1 DUF655 domain-containing protein [Candidatus Marsarchaeota archaeon]
MENQEREKREEYAYVLDFMLSGKSFSSRSEPLAQVMGEEWFTLLEVTPKPDATLNIGERVYIGKDERDKILLIKSRIAYDELTQTAKSSMPGIVATVVKQNEKKFVEFFNIAGPLNIREHSLELLPGVGKKHLEAILKTRSEKRFESFADITTRIPLLQDPAKLIAERIMHEIEGEERFYLFVKPYKKRY